MRMPGVTFRALALLLAAAGPLAAQGLIDRPGAGSALAPAPAPVSSVTLLPGWQAADGRRMAGVQVDLAPGWKTYWRLAAGAGIPPEFDWAGSANLAAARVHWPAPMVFESGGALSAGYAGRVVFPVALTPRDPAAPIALRLSLFHGVCREVCIPAEARVAATLPPDAIGGGPRIRAALASGPQLPRAAGFTGHRCTLRPDGAGGARLTVRLAHPGTPPLPPLALFESADPRHWIGAGKVRRRPGGLTVTARVGSTADGPLTIARDGIRLSLVGQGRAVTFDGCPAG